MGPLYEMSWGMMNVCTYVNRIHPPIHPQFANKKVRKKTFSEIKRANNDRYIKYNQFNNTTHNFFNMQFCSSLMTGLNKSSY